MEQTTRNYASNDVDAGHRRTSLFGGSSSVTNNTSRPKTFGNASTGVTSGAHNVHSKQHAGMNSPAQNTATPNTTTPITRITSGVTNVSLGVDQHTSAQDLGHANKDQHRNQMDETNVLAANVEDDDNTVALQNAPSHTTDYDGSQDIPPSPFAEAPLVCPGTADPMSDEWMESSFASLAQTLQQIQMQGVRAAFDPLRDLSTKLENRSEQLLEEHRMLKQEMNSYADFIMQQQRAAQDAEAAIQMRLLSRTNTKQRRYITNDNE